MFNMSSLSKTARAPQVLAEASMVDRLKLQLADAVAAFEKEQKAYAETLASAVTGDAADLGNVRKARSKLTSAESDVAANHDALKAAQRRLTAAEAEAIRVAKAAAYDAAHALFVQRVEVAKELTATFAKMAALKAKLDSLSDQGHNALPSVPDMDAALLRIEQINGLMAQERMRVGLARKTGLRPLHEIEPFHTLFAETPDLVKRWKHEATGE